MDPIDKNVTFIMSTILVQSLGLYMFPFIFQYVFSAGSERTVRFNQVINAPVHAHVRVPGHGGVLLPGHRAGLKNPDDAFMA